MRDYGLSFVLALQFLTTLPLYKTVEWNEKRARISALFFPVVGFIIGLFLYAFFHVLPYAMSTVSITLFCLFFSVLLTGGLHMDGFMDVSDAYFSYNKEKRREIMKDPNVGAFAVMAIIFLFAFRYVFMYESLMLYPFALLVIPVVSRTFMTCLLFGHSASEGLGNTFQKSLRKYDCIIVIGMIFTFLLLFLWMYNTKLVILLFIIASICFVSARKFFNRVFGGVNGDTLGAFIESVEMILWGVVWLYHF